MLSSGKKNQYSEEKISTQMASFGDYWLILNLHTLFITLPKNT